MARRSVLILTAGGLGSLAMAGQALASTPPVDSRPHPGVIVTVGSTQCSFIPPDPISQLFPPDPIAVALPPDPVLQALPPDPIRLLPPDPVFGFSPPDPCRSTVVTNPTG